MTMQPAPRFALNEVLLPLVLLELGRTVASNLANPIF
jgi:hypothetical protein